MSTRSIRRKLGIKPKIDVKTLGEGVCILQETSKLATKRVKEEIQCHKKLQTENEQKIKHQKRLVKKYKLQNLKERDNDRVKLKQIPVPLTQQSLENSIKILQGYEASTKKKKDQESIIISSCKKINTEFDSWVTASHIVKNIRHAVSNHDWDSLTHLLLLLLDHNECYLPFIKEMGFLDLLMNRSDYNSEVLETFTQQLFNESSANLGEFDIWFMEDST